MWDVLEEHNATLMSSLQVLQNKAAKNNFRPTVVLICVACISDSEVDTIREKAFPAKM